MSEHYCYFNDNSEMSGKTRDKGAPQPSVLVCGPGGGRYHVWTWEQGIYSLEGSAQISPLIWSASTWRAGREQEEV